MEVEKLKKMYESCFVENVERQCTVIAIRSQFRQQT